MSKLTKLTKQAWLVLVLFTPHLLGCAKVETARMEKAPRAVTVMTLQTGIPTSSRDVSATVTSWKTEEIGFEVSGRVRWVLEPGAEIEGRVFDSSGNAVTPGTALAQLDPERYSLAVESAKAQVSVAELQQAGIEVDLNSGIPADREAATADLDLAQLEYRRSKQLVAQNAVSQADLDKSLAQLRTTQARISTIDAQTKQTQAQLQSSVASVNQAKQSLKDAQRNLADTTLYSSFRGQVADVHVVPGSVVAQGSPVLTIQMMNPIKVEVELSAQQSRTISQRHTLPIVVTMPDGTKLRREGFVYAIAPAADTSTRTFTLTLLVLNEEIEQPWPEETNGKSVARTSDIWRMDFDFLPDAPAGTFYIDQKAICRDDQGDYVWKCLNAKVEEPLPQLLEVAKMRINKGDRSIPFLGNWVFQTVTVNDESFNPQADLFAGELQVAEGTPNDWNGKLVFMDRGDQWMLRPGDLVTVDLSATDTTAGLYVPVEAIYEESGKTYLFVAKTSGDGTLAKRIPVEVATDTKLEVGTVRRVLPPANEESLEGKQIIVGGVHFLNDGDQVSIVQSNL